MRTRIALAAALAALAAIPATGHAAAPKKPQVVDAAGDSLGAQSAAEIVSAVWSTTGDTTVTKVRGKRVTTYTPKRLVVTLNLAGAPGDAPFAYEAAAEVAGCGQVRFTYTPGTVYSGIVSDSMLWYDCGPVDPTTGDTLTLVPNVSLKVGAKSLTWEYPIKAFPKNIRAGAMFSDFRVVADVIDPVLGLYGPKDFAAPLDEGTGTGAWKLG
jgi:hypothetical protein